MPARTKDREAASQSTSLVEYLHHCPLCSSSDLRHYCRVPSLFASGEFIRYERCATCGIVLRNPRLSPTQRLDKYEYKVMSPEHKRLLPKSQVHYALMMRVIKKLVPDAGNRRLLDFGCGAGGLLVEARAAGFEVLGLELNRDLAQHVEKEHGIPVFQGLVSDPAFVNERFEVIVSSQVFEHLVDPRETLLELRGLLTRPGLLLIEVPNLLDTRERLRRGSTMDDAHLFYFSAKSLTRLLRDNGFRVLQVHQGLRPQRFLEESTRRVPVWLLRAIEQTLSALRLRTGLGVIALLD